MSQPETLMIGLRRREDQRAWENAKQAVADVLDEEPENLNRTTVARELSEAYTGNRPLGQWRNGDADG